MQRTIKHFSNYIALHWNTIYIFIYYIHWFREIVVFLVDFCQKILLDVLIDGTLLIETFILLLFFNNDLDMEPDMHGKNPSRERTCSNYYKRLRVAPFVARHACSRKSFAFAQRKRAISSLVVRVSPHRVTLGKCESTNTWERILEARKAGRRDGIQRKGRDRKESARYRVVSH